MAKIQSNDRFGLNEIPMRQVTKHKDVGLLNMIRRTDPVILSQRSKGHKNAVWTGVYCSALEIIFLCGGKTTAPQSRENGFIGRWQLSP
jgi:hypothetical protein